MEEDTPAPNQRRRAPRGEEDEEEKKLVHADSGAEMSDGGSDFSAQESSPSDEAASEKPYLPQLKMASTQPGAFAQAVGSGDEREKQLIVKKKRKVPNTVNKPTNETVSLWKPAYQHRTPVLYFPYPDYVGEKRPMAEGSFTEHSRSELRSVELQFRIAENTNIYNSVVNTFKRAGVKLVEVEGQNVLWTGSVKPDLLRETNKYQKLNHFPGSFQIGRKDCMWRNIARFRRANGLDYEICPPTYIFPEDYKRFIADREATEQNKALWILKPSASSCGKGIKLLTKKSQVQEKSGVIISKYVGKPFLINNRKFDLRIYVLVTSFDPLKVYLYHEGLVRFASEEYAVNSKTLKKRYVHLTNYSVNKKADTYVPAKQEADEDFNSCKWSLRMLRKQFEELGIPYDEVFMSIKDVIIKALIAIEPQIVNHMNRGTKFRHVCFEVYGFDILLDHALKPWLLEVNVSPSLSSSSPFDKKVKTMLVCDTMNLVGVTPYDRRRHEREVEEQAKNRLLGLEKSPSKQGSRGSVQDAKNKLSLDKLGEEDLNILYDFEEEENRAHNYQRIFPLQSNVDKYERFFEF